MPPPKIGHLAQILAKNVPQETQMHTAPQAIGNGELKVAQGGRSKIWVTRWRLKMAPFKTEVASG